MDIKTREIYSEVYCVLNMLGDEYIRKLPKNLYEMICEEKLNEYNPEYDLNLALEKQKIKRESIAMIALFHLNYWCDTEKEKQKLEKIFNENEEIYRKKMKEVYSSSNMFKKDIVIEESKEENSIQQIIEYKETLFKKIFNKLLKFFRIK